MIIGLTGRYCAGKNEVATLLEARGWTCIDVDRLGHEAVDLAKDAIVERFGSGILSSEGKVDRKALAHIIFSDRKALSDQESIIHPVAIRLLTERIAKAESLAYANDQIPKICINAALLHRTEHIRSCAVIIEIRAPLILRMMRGIRRDTSGIIEVVQRIYRQRGFHTALHAAARKSGRPIITIWNCGGLQGLKPSLEKALVHINHLDAR